MNLRVRITLALTGATATALLVSFASTYILVERDELRDLDRALQRLAERTVLLPIPSEQIRRLLDESDERLEPPGLSVRYIALYDALGVLSWATPAFGDAPIVLSGLGAGRTLPTSATDVHVKNGHLRGVFRRLPNGETLYCGASRVGVDADLGYLLRVFLVLFASGTFLTWLVGRWIGHALACDVDALAMVTERVASGDLRARAPALGTTAEIKRFAQQLNQMIERLAELVASQRLFVSSAAHELRSPLTSLRGELQLALLRDRTVDEYRETIERALSDAVALVTLTDDLLALARVESRASQAAGVLGEVAGSPPPPMRTRVSDILADARRMARGNADARGVQFVVRYDGVDQVSCSRQDVARALRNLLDNAVAHSPVGAEVDVDVTVTPTEVCIGVGDHGPGVQGGDRDFIFAPFFRGSQERTQDAVGAGLGLSLAREMARAHGGDVLLDVGYTYGARFVLTLPS